MIRKCKPITVGDYPSQELDWLRVYALDLHGAQEAVRNKLNDPARPTDDLVARLWTTREPVKLPNEQNWSLFLDFGKDLDIYTNESSVDSTYHLRHIGDSDA